LSAETGSFSRETRFDLQPLNLTLGTSLHGATCPVFAGKQTCRAEARTDSNDPQQGMPADVATRLNRAVGAALRTDEVKQPFIQQGVETEHSTPNELGATLRRDIDA
jgi:hypothetical protein